MKLFVTGACGYKGTVLVPKLLKAGHRIAEKPVTFNPRSRAAGKKIRWQDGVHAVRVLLRYKFGE